MSAVVSVPMIPVVSVLLSRCVASAVNVRPDRDDDVDDLVASIHAHGLMQPLVGRIGGDASVVEIVDGGRRLRALRRLEARGEWGDSVQVMLRDADDARAAELSLAANVVRRALHPVDEYEAFAALIDRGGAVDAIADHFGVTPLVVRRRLALARLHAEVRAAWRAGRIGAETAQAFTVAPPEEQAAYLARAGASTWGLEAGRVREALTRTAVSADAPLARFVGAEAYRAAGGAFVEDLFVEQPEFADSALLRRLADERLAREAARIRAEEGWGDVLFDEAARTAAYAWARLPKPAAPEIAHESAMAVRLDEIDARLDAIAERDAAIDREIDAIDSDGADAHAKAAPLLDEQAELSEESDRLADERDALLLALEGAAWMTLPAEARAGAVALVEIGTYGDLIVRRGLLRDVRPGRAAPSGASPAAAKQAAAPDGPGEPLQPEPAALSAKLVDELALAATRAAAHTIAGQPRLAKAVLIASLYAYGSPARLSMQGRGQGPRPRWAIRAMWSDEAADADFSTILRAALAMDDAGLDAEIATLVAAALDFTAAAVSDHSMNALTPQAAQDVRCALPLAAHRAALVEAFDAEAYFKAAPKSESLDAIAACGDEPAKFAKLKKPDLAAAAARLAKGRAWLPPLLRGDIFAALDPDCDASSPSCDAAGVAGAEPSSPGAHAPAPGDDDDDDDATTAAEAALRKAAVALASEDPP